MFNLSTDCKLVLAKVGTTTATTEYASDCVDTLGYDGVAFFGSVGTANAGNFAKLQQGAASDGSDAADLAGTKCVPATNGHSFYIECFQPQKRYVRADVIRAGASTVLGDIYALLYRADRKPVAAQGTTIKKLFVQSPAEGTIS